MPLPGAMGAPNPSPHVLLVDDDRELCDLLSRFLSRHGLRVSVVHDGKSMARTLASSRINLVILDLMLPGDDGLTLCRKLRAESTVPIIMLTAMGEDVDRIIGLEMGADDYIAKVANPRELLARIRAVLRRAGAPAKEGAGRGACVLEFLGWRLDVPHRQLTSPKGALIVLRAAEFDLLLAFAERPNRILTRDQLLDLSRSRGPSAFDRSIDVQISRLRRKLEADARRPTLIRTVRNGGYVFSAHVNRTPL